MAPQLKWHSGAFLFWR